ncbi:MAG: hypothetical protein JNL92_14320 [Opitutaceae bacterium]|nr:hypothetical protein [Opitutaceae bacterium]
MLFLENPFLRVAVLDPADPADLARQGSRYCHGGYVWQVSDAAGVPLLAGPEFPHPDPSAFNGQGLPESFRHRRRDGTPLTWSADIGLGIGIGELAAPARDLVEIRTKCPWSVDRSPDALTFQTRQTGAGFACELTRTLRLVDCTVGSFSELTNVGARTLELQWFAHPFWPLTDGQARVRLPAGTTVPENPGFAIAAEGTLRFRRPFVSPDDSQFALLTLPPHQPLRLSVDHPRLARVSFETSFVPDECPVWANAHTISVEPYLNLRLAPGETRRWHVQHRFEARPETTRAVSEKA